MVMDPGAVAAFDRLGEQYPDLLVTSAYRDEEHNRAVGGAKDSQHLEGKAYDIDVSGMPRADQLKLIRTARKMGFSGVGIYEGSLHFDTGPERAWGADYSNKSVPRWARKELGLSENPASIDMTGAPSDDGLDMTDDEIAEMWAMEPGGAGSPDGMGGQPGGAGAPGGAVGDVGLSMGLDMSDAPGGHSIGKGIGGMIGSMAGSALGPAGALGLGAIGGWAGGQIAEALGFSESPAEADVAASNAAHADIDQAGFGGLGGGGGRGGGGGGGLGGFSGGVSPGMADAAAGAAVSGGFSGGFGGDPGIW